MVFQWQDNVNNQHHNFVFIGGLHRSGTSILFRAIREHPLISGFENTNSPENEGMHLQTIYKPSGEYGGAGRFGLNQKSHLTEESPQVNEVNRKKLFAEWSRYWDLDKPFLLEKSPSNLIQTRFIQAIFPKSYFIIILRHPIVVSLATRRWYRTMRFNRIRLRTVFEHWVICHERFQNDQRYLTNSLILKYENFISHPEDVMRKINSFLGLANHPLTEPVITGINEKYFKQWAIEQRGIFSKYATRQVVRDYETRVNRFGYSLNNLEMT